MTPDAIKKAVDWSLQGAPEKEPEPAPAQRFAQCAECDKRAESKESLPHFTKGGDLKTSPHYFQWKRAWEDCTAFYQENLAYPNQAGKTLEQIAILEATNEAMKLESQSLYNLVIKTAAGDTFYCGCKGWD